MFGSGSGAAPAHQSSRLSVPVLIPYPFVWPYGGRSVFLSGSFTRWLEHIPMAPMEGHPTVFQVVWNLTPGYHQYKFFVDGQWRHNEHQPFVNANGGTVNTIFLAGEDIVPTSFSPETSGGSNMDVDMVPTNVETVPRFSQADLDISRHRISMFLSRHTAYELLPESGKVIALDNSLPVKQAFHILHEQGVPVAPLWDFEKGQFVGVLSAMDFILILRELGNHGSNLTEEELETHTVAAWKEGKINLNRQLDGNGRYDPPHLVSAGPYDSLKEVALKILQKQGGYSSNCPFNLAEWFISSTIAPCFPLRNTKMHFRHSSSSLPILQCPISEFRLGTWVPNIGESNGRPLAMLRPNSSLADVFSLLIQADVSSIPIVDGNDSLLDIYSRSDITALARDKAYTQICLDELSIHQALLLGQDANSPSCFLSGQRCQMCLRSDSLHKVMERLANPGVRRLVIVEAGSKRVEGIISLSDVFRFLLG